MMIHSLPVPAPATDSIQIEQAGNPPCPVCTGECLVRVMFRGEWTWDACRLCAEQAEMVFQMEVRR